MIDLTKIAGGLAGWKGYAAAVGVALVVGAGAAWTAQGWRKDALISNIERDQAVASAVRVQAAIAAAEAARTEERRRIAALETARDEAKKEAALALADAAVVRAELGGLRAHANALARTAAARYPEAAAGSPPGAGGADLLAYMLGRVSDRAAELAGIADGARIAGLTCERAYDALTAAE